MSALLDVSDAFDIQFLSDIIIKRYDIRLNDEGEYEQIGFTAKKMKAVVIPNDAQASVNQTHYNVSDSIQAYIKAQKINIQTEITPSDYIVYAGKEYKITGVGNFLYGKGFVRVLGELVSDYDSE